MVVVVDTKESGSSRGWVGAGRWSWRSTGIRDSWDLMDGLTGLEEGRGREPRARYGVHGPESKSCFLMAATL